jgi:FkbM family methyltransferase
MRRTLEEAWLYLIRLYTYNTPISKGKYRLFQEAMSLCALEHRSLNVTTRDGRPFMVDLTTGMQEHVFFFGEYEKVESGIASKLIKAGDVCLDVGAHFGWYTTLMAKLAGSGGEVHAFEPVPHIFRELERNVELAGSPDNIKINNLALGDTNTTITLNVFDGEPSGHASIGAKKDVGAERFECQMIRLDGYLSENVERDVTFVKVDIEGAELMLLKGAERLFTQAVPPIFLMEMALSPASLFDYRPDELVQFIGSRGDYVFLKVLEERCRMVEIDGFADDDVGANVFCIPRQLSLEPIADLIEP